MINETELRVGNLVLEGGEEHLVDLGDFYLAHLFDPVQITKKRLIEEGFIEEERALVYRRARDVFKLESYLVTGFKEEGVKHTFLKYMHQLQNYYFATRGQELLIKPKTDEGTSTITGEL